MYKIDLSKVNRLTKIVFITLAITCISGLIGTFLWGEFTGPNRKEMILQEALPITFKGTVDSIYNDKQNHNVEVLVLSNGSFFDLWPEWENEVGLGDTMIKAKGTLQIKVRKLNGHRLILDYKKLVNDIN